MTPLANRKLPAFAARNALDSPPPLPHTARVPEKLDIHYTCQRCTNCCRWPGIVRVDENEITRIAAHVGMSEEDFLARHTRLRPDRRGLSLIERSDGSCEWLDGNDCRLQAVKPAQCRTFPNEWNFPGWREKCEATPSLTRDGN